MNKAVKLLISYNDFEEVHPDAELEDFCRYYLAKSRKKRVESSSASRGTLLKLMGRITSAFSLYHRAAMNKTALPNAESFYYLNALATLGEVRKTELINYLLTEYATGMEAINKLLHEKLIREKNDKSDGRAKLLSLTEKGEKVLLLCYSYAKKAGEMIFGELDEDSIQLCIQLLRTVEEKHSRLAIELKNKDFDEMYALAKDHQSKGK